MISLGRAKSVSSPGCAMEGNRKEGRDRERVASSQVPAAQGLGSTWHRDPVAPSSGCANLGNDRNVKPIETPHAVEQSLS